MAKTTKDGELSVSQTIGRLERWHRVWEMRNPDKIVHPTFATPAEVAHECRYGVRIIKGSGQAVTCCRYCYKKPEDEGNRS